MAPELSMCEPRRVIGRAQRTTRGLTASGSLVQIDVQLWGYWASALPLTPSSFSDTLLAGLALAETLVDSLAWHERVS